MTPPPPNWVAPDWEGRLAPDVLGWDRHVHDVRMIQPEHPPALWEDNPLDAALPVIALSVRLAQAQAPWTVVPFGYQWKVLCHPGGYAVASGPSRRVIDWAAIRCHATREFLTAAARLEKDPRWQLT